MASRRLRRRAVDAILELVSVDPAGAEAQECLGRYFTELAARFPEGFEIGSDAPPDADDFRPPGGCLVIARLNGKPAACGALRVLERDIGEIKRMWVAPEIRASGVGRRMLEQLEREARRRGLRVVRLDTHSVLSEALRLYRSAGYREIARFNDNPYAHHWFEKAL